MALDHRLLNSVDVAAFIDCGCNVYVWKDGSGAEVEYCPMHKAAPELLEALKDLDTRIMPEERKYDEWGYCRIHKDILYEFDAIIKQAIRKAGGDA